jgi:hypothetical protein
MFNEFLQGLIISATESINHGVGEYIVRFLEHSDDLFHVLFMLTFFTSSYLLVRIPGEI